MPQLEKSTSSSRRARHSGSCYRSPSYPTVKQGLIHSKVSHNRSIGLLSVFLGTGWKEEVVCRHDNVKLQVWDEIAPLPSIPFHPDGLAEEQYQECTSSGSGSMLFAHQLL